jgi:hypothetical protein
VKEVETMWPAVFGSGWMWGVLLAVALVCFIVGVLGFLFVVIVKPPRRQPDELDEAWHRYEEGDLTLSEWQRKVHRFAKTRAS